MKSIANDTKTYSELRKLKTYKERFEYLKLGGVVGEVTFGLERYLNQVFYTSNKWKKVRDKVIIRDNSCDLGLRGYEIGGTIFVHHMNPITVKDIELERPEIFEPEFLVSCSFETHNLIHYGNNLSEIQLLLKRERTPNDTCPWKEGM